MTCDHRSTPRAPAGFWVLGLVLVGYVGACTIHRDNKWGADAWEHQRAVLALTRNLWKPGNPTYLSDLPSVRYSPYTVALAEVCRRTGIEPYTALSLAAVVNTALLVLGVWLLLGAFNDQAASAAVLTVMVVLYGSAPGYANSYALADLPWHQVNPSAFSFALTLIAWSLFRRIGARRWDITFYLLVVLLATIAMLDHPMTGAFGIMGLFILAITGPAPLRGKMLLAASVITMLVGGLCLAWPWYGFLDALRTHQDADYWFNRGVLRLTLTQWCAPALLCALFALPLRQRPLVKTCLVGGIASFACGVMSLVTRSPVLARFPLPGMIYLHVAIGVFAHDTGTFRLSTWRQRLRAIAGPKTEASAPILQTVLAAMMIYFLVPQFIAIATEPHLGRAYVARVLRHRDLQQPVRRTFANLLAPIGQDDVVLTDLETAWLVPSFRGRIIAAIHFELFVPHQAERREAVARFFSPEASEAQRERILRDYHARWIVLNPRQIEPSVFRSLLRESAVVQRSGDLILMSTPRWLAAAHPPWALDSACPVLSG